MFKFIISDNNPRVLIITPLKECFTISDYTISSVIGTNVPIHWVSYSGDQNPYKNFDCALQYYKRFHTVPEYLIKIDNDIKAEPNMIDSMVNTLDNSHDDIAYTYCDFKFEGTINMSFKAIPFNADRLMKSNYISSISMMRYKVLQQIGGVEVDDKYFRLLDWALWLKFLSKGYHGVPTVGTSFIAHSSKNSVSSGSSHDYIIKHKNVYNDFIKPML